MCLEKIVPHVPEIIGGSADLAASNLTFVKGMKTITAEDYDGNNLMYGIREHAMGAIMNGLALHGGVIPTAVLSLSFPTTSGRRSGWRR